MQIIDEKTYSFLVVINTIRAQNEEGVIHIGLQITDNELDTFCYAVRDRVVNSEDFSEALIDQIKKDPRGGDIVMYSLIELFAKVTDSIFKRI